MRRFIPSAEFLRILAELEREVAAKDEYTRRQLQAIFSTPKEPTDD